MAPDGNRICMMEPGEAPRPITIGRAGDALLISAGRSELSNVRPPVRHDFVRILLAHEIFVAMEKRSGVPVGFAAAQDIGDLSWLSEMAVDPNHGRRAIGAARCFTP